MRTQYTVRGFLHELFGTVLISAAVALPPGTSAEAQPIELPGIVIEGSTIAVTGEDGGQPVANQGTAVTVVTGEELRQRQVRYVADALRSLPGVQVHRTGSNAGLTQVRIRGAEGNHTLVLIDGVEANAAADGEFDFSNFLVEDIDRIEVLRGPQSGLYGSGAIGGVINIITRSGRGPLTIKARLEAGSFATRDGAVSVSAGNDKLHGIIGVSGRKTDGFNISATGDEDDGSRISSFYAKGGVRPLENVWIDGVVRRISKNGERDEEDFSVPAGALVPQIDAPSRFSTDLWIYAIEGRAELADGRWLHSLRAERSEIAAEDLSVNPLFGTNFESYESQTDKLRYTTTYRLETLLMPHVRHYLTGLVEKTDEVFTVFTSDGIARERTRKSYAGEVRGEYWDRLFLAASVRHDDNQVFEDFTTWRTTASFLVPQSTVRLHASAGSGVKFPSLFEQFGRFPSFFVPNPDLLPEESVGWDAGAEIAFAGGRAVLDITYFDTELENKITRSGFTVINLPGLSTRDGVEVALRVTPMPGLTLGGSYTYLLADDANGLPELRRPRHSGKVDVNYAFDGGRGNVTFAAHYNGSMFDEPINSFFIPTRVALDEYWLATAAASYQLLPGVEVYGRVENVFDTKYNEVFGFETAGIAAYAGVRLTFEQPAGASASR